MPDKPHRANQARLPEHPCKVVWPYLPLVILRLFLQGAGGLFAVERVNRYTPRVFSLIIYLSVLGLALYAFIVWLQRRLVFWDYRDDPAGISQITDNGNTVG